MVDLASAKTTATLYLDEIEATLSIRRAFNEIIVARQGQLFPAFQHDPQGKASLVEALKSKSVDESALNRGLVIQVNSVFELFIRSLVAAVTDHIAASVHQFSKTEKKFQSQFLAHAGRVMNYLPSGSLNGQNFDFQSLLDSVRMCLGNESPYQIYSPAFSVLMGNCTPEKLEKLFDIFGLVKPFADDLGRNKELQRVVNERGHRRAANLARSTLRKQIDLRNDIVHGQLARAVSTADVVDSVAFFRALVDALSGVVEHELNA